jgi:16S rRNA U1498 N3-methylase RsmE
MKAQRFVQSELERFQESLQRCVSQCQDDIKDKVSPTSSEADITRFRNDFEKCAISCCDKNIERLPSIAKRVKETLQSGKY